MTAALRCAAPRTNSSSGSAARHSALETQAILDSASAPNGMVAAGAAAFVLRVAVRIPDTSDSPSLLPRCGTHCVIQKPDATYATLSPSVLPVSHCVDKLRGQVPITQHSDTPFFGTTVQSDHEGGSGPGE